MCRGVLVVSVFAVSVLACAESGFVSKDLGGGGKDAAIDQRHATDDATMPDFGGGDIPQFVGEAMVYAHSAQVLFKIDPDSLTVSEVASFGWPQTPEEMTDIAVDRDGKMIGISFHSVYAVDPETAVCTYLAPLDRDFNGLSFISDDSNEILVGTAMDGSVYRIDPQTGKSQQIGSFGGGLQSSGDLVSVKGFGTVATVKQFGGSSDFLARVNPQTGQAVLIGETGFSNIWGVGFWKNEVYGFTETSQFVLIDVTTGKGKLISREGGPWWGAGVTTIAPVIK